MKSKSNKIVKIPKESASKSVRLASLFTKGCVDSSIIPIVKRKQKIITAVYLEGGFWNDRITQKVIVP